MRLRDLMPIGPWMRGAGSFATVVITSAALLACGGGSGSGSGSIGAGDGGACVSRTCGQLAATCGDVSDGCGAALSCGACSTPETCGGGGIPNVCGSASTAPAAPGNVAASAGTGFILLRWASPADAGASGVSAYTVVATAAGSTPVQVKTSETSALVNGLTNGTRYSLTVVAENSAGKSPPSAPVEATPRSACSRSFALYRTLPVGTFPVGVTTADLTGAKRRDLVVANEGFFPGTGTVSVLMNDGAANFSKSVEYPVADSPQSLAVADFDGNGTEDVIAAGTRETILFNDGKGVLAPSSNFGGGADSIAVADVNRDGSPDVVLAFQGASSARVALNRGDGAFGSFAGFGDGIRPYAAGVGDFNSDGIPDLVVGYQSEVDVMLGNGDGTFGPQAPLANVPAFKVAVGDFNGDGLPDIAVGNEVAVRKEVTVLFNQGGGRLAFQAVEIPSGITPVVPVTADIDRDGRTDLVYTDQGVSFGVLRSLGGGAFAPPMVFNTPGMTAGITAADFNGDGFPDVAVTEPRDNAVSIFINVCE